MKQLFTLVLAAMAFVACTQNEVEEFSANRADVPETLTVGFDGGDTRIELNEALKTVWTEGDEVSVFYRSDINQRWQYQGETGERVGDLRCVDASSGTPTKTTKVVIAYPYSDSYYLNTESCDIQAMLPAVQGYKAGSYGEGGNLMVSSNYYNQFSLKSVVGWLRVELTGEGQMVESIMLRGNAGEQVAGELYIDTATAEATLASERGEAGEGAGGSLIFDDTISMEVTLDCGEGVTLGAEATEFYIALPPQTFAEGLTVTIYCSDSTMMTKNYDSSIEIKRNHILPTTPFRYEGVKIEKPIDDLAITVKNITQTSAVINVIPNYTIDQYYLRALTRIELDAFGIYNNDLEIFRYILDNPNINDYIYAGEQTIYDTSLAPEQEYLVAAFTIDNYEAVMNGKEELKLYRYAFTTPEGEPVDPNSLFITSNLHTTTKGFTLDVTPVKGEESFWTYYIWPKTRYDETLAYEAKVNIVMRSYFGLYNLGMDQGYDFGTFIQEYMGHTSTSQILNYEPLNNNTEYVVVLFYMDPNVKDPTEVYDYNYVAVEFKTDSPAAGNEASLEVSEPVIVADGMKYTINFVVKTNENAVDLKVNAQLYANYDFAKYWDENDWSQIQAFFLFRTSVSAETLAAAKSAEGATVSFTDFDKDEYAFFFEAISADNTPTQYGVHVTPGMFE